mgnify:CR=1 FL=1
MGSDVHIGDIVLVRVCEEILNAHTVIVLYEGNCYYKKVVQKDYGILLMTLNKIWSHNP